MDEELERFKRDIKLHEYAALKSETGPTKGLRISARKACGFLPVRRKT
jgi:hypothetical protein